MSFYLVPNLDTLDDINWLELIVAAMGQAFFTLSVGIGSIAIFGSYIKKDRTLLSESLPIIGMDTMVAFLAGVIIFPACTTYDVNVSAGPGLVFISLPEVFNRMNIIDSSHNSKIQQNVVAELIQMFDTINELTKTYRAIRDRFQTNTLPSLN